MSIITREFIYKMSIITREFIYNEISVIMKCNV